MKVKSKTSKKVRTPRDGRVAKDLELALRLAAQHRDLMVPGSIEWLKAVREYDRIARTI